MNRGSANAPTSCEHAGWPDGRIEEFLLAAKSEFEHGEMTGEENLGAHVRSRRSHVVRRLGAVPSLRKMSVRAVSGRRKMRQSLRIAAFSVVIAILLAVGCLFAWGLSRRRQLRLGSVLLRLRCGEHRVELLRPGQRAEPVGATSQRGLSRCHAKSASGLRLTDFQAAATASRHVVIAAARSTR